ncbi:hypothetical protein QQ045_009605 [Rhodiola kirilowii]
MESSVIMSLSKISFTPLNPGRNRTTFRAQPSRRLRIPTRRISQKMYVPGFGEKSPEAKAAINLHNFFTYIAVRIVMAQLESYNTEAHKELMEFVDRNSLNDGDKFCADLMRESHRHKTLGIVLHQILPDNKSTYCLVLFGLTDHIFNLWNEQTAAMRILEVRSSYCKEDFEWDNMQRLSAQVCDICLFILTITDAFGGLIVFLVSMQLVDESNKQLMREYLLETSNIEKDK